jgi:hypothetical protein
MTRRAITPRERLADTIAAAYEVSRAGLCLETVRETYRTPKAVAGQLQAAIVSMHRDHLMHIDRIAYALNRDRGTVRYHLKNDGDKLNNGDNYIATCSSVLIGDGCYPLETAQ